MKGKNNITKLLFLIIIVFTLIILFIFYFNFYKFNNKPNYYKNKNLSKPFLVKEELNNKKYAKILGVGINVNWMTFNKVNNYYFYWREKGINICKLFKEQGFNSIRLRVNSNVLFNKTKMSQLEDIVDDCLKVNEPIVIAYSASEYLENPNNLNNQKLFVNFWVNISKRFKNKSYLLSYDLIIEPGKKAKLYPNLTVDLMKKAFKEIRKIDKKRIIIIPLPQASKPYSLDYIKNFPFDNYSLIEWHIYASGPCKKLKYLYYNNASNYYYFNKTFIEQSYKIISDFMNYKNIPSWFGAVRFNCYPKGEKSEKAKDGSPKGFYSKEKTKEFAMFICKESKKYNIPFSINADTKFFDIKELKWFPSQQDILKQVFICWNN